MSSSEIWRLSAAQVAALVVQRKLSATEAAQAALARLEAVNPQLNAVVDCRPDEVLQRAAVDAALARGEAPGPLAGVPVTVKVNIDQAGFATTNGVRLQKDLIAADNSPVVDNLMKAGAVIIGRTNTPAFSYRWFTSNSLHGRTLNPRNVALAGQAAIAGAMSGEQLSATLVRRATLARQWQRFLAERYPVLLMPVSAGLPFAAELDLQGPEAYARVWAAQMPMIGLPFVGLPGLAVSTGMAGPNQDMPVGVQLVAGRFREDLCLAAGEAIEARGVPPMPAPL